MQFSTPVQSGSPTSLRKQALIPRVSLTPLRRVSIVPQKQPVDAPANDDEQERNIRRGEVEQRRRISNILLQQADSPHLRGPQLTKHYDMCMKMFTENKINVQNVWNLHIIDYMKAILDNQTNNNSFQVATVTLDVSTKVYGIRVDDIYSEGMKLASSMARASTKDAEDNEDGENDNQVGESEEQQGAKKKRTKRNKIRASTLATNIKSLFADIPQVDVVYSHSALIGDAQTSDRLFITTLPLNHHGNYLLTLSDEFEWDSENKNISEDAVVPFELPKVTNYEICPPFSTFVIDKWDPDQENLSMFEKEKPMEDVILDEAGIPIPELDGSVHDIFTEGGGFVNDDIEDVTNEYQIHGEVAHIVNFRPSGNENQSSDYLHNAAPSLRSSVISGLWAGPSHWKVKYIQNRLSRYSGQVIEKPLHKPARRVKLQSSMLEYTPTFPKTDINIIKNGFKLKSMTGNMEKYTMPEDPGVLVPNLFFLLRSFENVLIGVDKPIEVSKTEEQEDGDDNNNMEINDFDYQNSNDAEYCSQSHNDEHLLCDNENAASQMFAGDNLVDAPDLVPTTYVPYAIHAKKMDMKKLKIAVWESLETKRKTLTKNPSLEESKFSEIYNNLPKLLPQRMIEELSCPLAFIALLHLANEYNLQLECLDRKEITVIKHK